MVPSLAYYTITVALLFGHRFTAIAANAGSENGQGVINNDADEVRSRTLEETMSALSWAETPVSENPPAVETMSALSWTIKEVVETEKPADASTESPITPEPEIRTVETMSALSWTTPAVAVETSGPSTSPTKTVTDAPTTGSPTKKPSASPTTRTPSLSPVSTISSLTSTKSVADVDGTVDVTKEDVMQRGANRYRNDDDDKDNDDKWGGSSKDDKDNDDKWGGSSKDDQDDDWDGVGSKPTSWDGGYTSKTSWDGDCWDYYSSSKSSKSGGWGNGLGSGKLLSRLSRFSRSGRNSNNKKNNKNRTNKNSNKKKRNKNKNKNRELLNDSNIQEEGTRTIDEEHRNLYKPARSPVLPPSKQLKKTPTRQQVKNGWIEEGESKLTTRSGSNGPKPSSWGGSNDSKPSSWSGSNDKDDDDYWDGVGPKPSSWDGGYGGGHYGKSSKSKSSKSKSSKCRGKSGKSNGKNRKGKSSGGYRNGFIGNNIKYGTQFEAATIDAVSGAEEGRIVGRGVMVLTCMVGMVAWMGGTM